MKKSISSILVAIFLFILISVNIRSATNYPIGYQITVSTNSTFLVGLQPGRKYFLAVNESDVYDVRISSTQSSRLIKQGIVLSRSKGSYEDVYFVYTSSWYGYVDGTAGTAIINITYKE